MFGYQNVMDLTSKINQALSSVSFLYNNKPKLSIKLGKPSDLSWGEDLFFFFLCLSSSKKTVLESLNAEKHFKWEGHEIHSGQWNFKQKFNHWIYLRFNHVSAAMNKALNRRENPNRAPMHIQNQYSCVKKPLELRRTLPTVGSWNLGSKLGCNLDRTDIIFKLNLDPKETSMKMSYRTPSFVKEFIDDYGILSIHHRRNVEAPYHKWTNVICKWEQNRKFSGSNKKF